MRKPCRPSIDSIVPIRALLLRWIPLLIAALTLCGQAQALTQPQARSLVAGEIEDRIAALHKVIDGADDKTVALIQAISDDSVKFTDKAVFVMKDGKGHDPVTGAETPVPDAAEDVVNNNEMRSELDAALASVKLLLEGRHGPRRCGEDHAAGRSRRFQAAADREGLRRRAPCRRSRKSSASCAPPCCWPAPTRPSASMRPGRSACTGTPATKTLLQDRQKIETDADVKAAIGVSLGQIEGRLAWGERIGVIFTGISLGSILLLVALGLAITYGLMGVINMAHGELMMIGAYTTYVVQNLFRAYLPGCLRRLRDRRDSRPPSSSRRSSAPCSSAASSASSTAGLSRRFWPPGASA